MRFDTNAIDTIFGALVLIISCFACSGIVMLIDDDHKEPSNPIPDLEKRFDMCLFSTISIEHKIMDCIIQETTQVIDYIAALSILKESKSDESRNETAYQILNLFEFYFFRHDFWQLSILKNGDERLLIAQSGVAIVNSDIIVLERNILSFDTDAYTISLTIEL